MHLVLHVCIFEHQRQRGDVLPVHLIAAPNLYGMLDAYVYLLRGGVPYVRYRAVGEGGEDLQEQAGGVGLKAFFLESRSGLSCTYTVHVNGVPKRNIWVPTAMGFADFWRSI